MLLLFRLHKYFFICNIKRMFRNILVTKDQRSLQNIFWRDSPDQDIKCLQLNTVTYGLKNSSFLATRCLNELANKFQNDYPLASPVILNSTYVDDVLYTHDDIKTLIKTKNELIELLAKGSFNLHKWSANDKQILQDIPEEQQNYGEVLIQNNIKTLGLNFDINSDSFKFSPPPKQSVKTKREILSFITKFYDPLGLIGPVLVESKQIMQKLWLSNTDWDSIPPTELNEEWQIFYNNLVNMKPIQPKRNVCPYNMANVQLIGFSDASNIATGCLIYLRTTDRNGKVTMSLLCSKSRINPKDNKKLTVPRLELNGALLLAKLCARVYKTINMKVPINKVHLFSDSQVVLAWLKTDPIKLNTYVANRVKLISDYTKDFDWSYVTTGQNPADCLSRGVKPSELQNHPLWWSGPQEMSNSNYNFNDCSFEVPSDLPEIKPSAMIETVCAVSQASNEVFFDTFITRYSDINKAQRVLAYILRFCKNIKPNSDKINQDFISYSEANEALNLLIKHEQHKYFQKEIHALRKNEQLKSHLKSLNPF